MSLSEEARVVTSPVATSPTGALIQELDVVLESGLDLALLVVLDPSLPLVRDKPPGNKIIIVSVELELSPALGLETVEEQRTLEDFGSKGTCPSRHTGSTAINPMGGRNLKITPLDVGCTKPVVNPCGDGASPRPLDSLARADSTYLCVFKWCQEPGYYGSGPRDIIVSHDDKRCPDPGNSLVNLNPFVCNWDMENADGRCFQGLDKGIKTVISVCSRDQKKLIWVASENALERFPQLFKIVVYSGNYYSDIFGRV